MVAASLLLSAFAWGGDVSGLPSPPGERPTWEPVEGDCPEAVPVRPGEPVPEWLVQDGRWTCGAVLTPVGDSLHRTELIAWGDAWHAYGLGVESRWRLDTQALTLRLELADREIERLSRPPPLLERPGTIRALSDAKVAIILGAAVYLIARGSDATR